MLKLVFAFLFLNIASASGALLINGVGSSFPYPIYSKWFYEYHKINPEMKINYQSLGSGAGIQQLLLGTVDFGASDVPMNKEELKKTKIPILHIPMILGAIALAYNVPGVKENIRLSPEILAGIYLGRIKKWNDIEIFKINPNVKLPDLNIIPIFRSDGSGATAIFSKFLQSSAQTWPKSIGAGKAVKWPVGLGGKGNEGVAALILQTQGSIGFLEQVYAIKNHLNMAALQNTSGQFVMPSPDSVGAAAIQSLKVHQGNLLESLIGSRGEKSYPLSTYTYILVFQKMPLKKGEALIHFLKWSLTEGQVYAKNLSYVPLPPQIIKKAESEIDKIKIEQ